jgi:hypothetical protein
MARLCRDNLPRFGPLLIQPSLRPSFGFQSSDFGFDDAIPSLVLANRVASEVIRRSRSSSDRRLRKLFKGRRGLPFTPADKLCPAQPPPAQPPPETENGASPRLEPQRPNAPGMPNAKVNYAPAKTPMPRV